MQHELAGGAVVGERFEILELAGRGDLGCVYKARDTKTDTVVALRVIGRDEIPNDADVERLRQRVKEASSLAHRNVRGTFGMGVESDGTIYVSVEWVDGRNLATMLASHAEAGKRFSFKGAYNIIGHVCNGVAYAHQKTNHAALSPRAIMVNSAGRVKVSDWGLSTVRVRLENYPGRAKDESAFWAPEVLRSPDSATSRSDIFSIGALFYFLITGVPPLRPLRAPSSLGFDKAVDAVIARCMSADPMQRYATADLVKDAISNLVKLIETPTSETVAGAVDDHLDIDVEVDLGALGAPEAASVTAPNIPPPQARASAAVSMPSPSSARGSGMLSAPGLPPPPSPRGSGMLSAAGLPPPPSSRGSGMLSAPGLPPPPSLPAGTEGVAAFHGRASAIDMGAVLNSIGQSEAPHWMVQKDKFDHGPFTDRELVQMILLGEVQYKHNLLNMDTGVRKKVKAWPEFEEYLERYRVKKKQAEEAAALRKTEAAEKRGTAFKLMIAAGVLGAVGLAIGGYLLSRGLRKEKTFDRDEMIAKLDSGEIKLKLGSDAAGGGGKRGGKRRGGGGGGGGGGGEFLPGMTYEQAMAAGIDLGSLTNNTGQKQLTAEVIQEVMDRNVRRFLHCMDGSTKRVDLEIAVGGDGRVVGVSANAGSSGLRRCCESIVRGIKFPTSAAPRTATSWWFEVDY